jgi:hypothetical protein
MATILVYNQDTNKIEKYTRNLNDAMPYVTGNTLTVDEFQGSSKSDIIWTTKAFMQAWNSLRRQWGKPIYVGYAFKRIWQGGHSGMSQHYAGLAMDTAQTFSNTSRNRLRELAIDSRLFTYVEPKALTPTWVHFDKRYGTPACSTGGYPLIKFRSRGVYVMVLQDALNYLGYSTGGIDGIFGNKTLTAVKAFQRANNLSSDGIVGCGTWRKLTNKF